MVSTTHISCFIVFLRDNIEHQPSVPDTVTHHHDSPEPSNRKRKENPATTSTETTVVTKSLKVEGSGSRGRVRAADFSELTRSIIEETISIYRAQIGSVEPFPERTDDRDIVKQAWIEVCTGRSLRVEIEEDIFKFVSYSVYYRVIITLKSPCRLLPVLLKLEDMLKHFPSRILYWPIVLMALDQNAKFATELNNFWMEPGSFTRLSNVRLQGYCH